MDDGSARDRGEIDALYKCVAGRDSSSFDELVHEAAAERAAAVNNSGLHAQVVFLWETCGYKAARHLLNDVVREIEGTNCSDGPDAGR